jgi:hypothetical protein
MMIIIQNGYQDNRNEGKYWTYCKYDRPILYPIIYIMYIALINIKDSSQIKYQKITKYIGCMLKFTISLTLFIWLFLYLYLN